MGDRVKTSLCATRLLKTFAGDGLRLVLQFLLGAAMVCAVNGSGPTAPVLTGLSGVAPAAERHGYRWRPSTQGYLLLGRRNDSAQPSPL